MTLAGYPVTQVTWLSLTRIVIIAPASPAGSLSGSLAYYSFAYGVGFRANAFTYNNFPFITAIVRQFFKVRLKLTLSLQVPPCGPLAGGFPVTIQGGNFGPNLISIDSIALRNAIASPYSYISSTALVATAPPASTSGPGFVDIVSVTNGPASFAFGFTHSGSFCLLFFSNLV